jgi:hypothetical protein
VVPPSLKPVQLQLEVPHDAWIDVLPFASLRAAILIAKLIGNFDEIEFIRDIDSGTALVCCGATPWDEWNWMVNAWFVAKWESVLGWKK